MGNQQAFIKVNGEKIHDTSGKVIILQGVGLGGWMNMENFITGFPANENAFRQVITRALGKEKTEFFYDRYLEYFFTPADAQFIRSVGMNHVRLPFGYRHFEDDLDPMVLKENGFRFLDRAIKICADHGLYTILDLHAAAGCQNQDWHSDNPTHQAFFWQHKHFQDRTVWLWQQLADRYKDNPWVAGYNPLNEPADPSGEMLGPFYRRVVSAIREIDPDHIIFLEGNRYAQDVTVLGEPIPNCVYAIHNYATPGFIDGGPYPGLSRGEYFDQSVLYKKYLDACEYMLKNKTPIWIGEFGPVYTGILEEDTSRYEILKQQLSFYRKLGANWSLWTYKDLGLHGMVQLLPGTKWMQKIRTILEKKNILGVDSWSGVDRNIRHIMAPIEKTFAEFFPDYKPFPFGVQWQINRIVRHILLAEPLVEEFQPMLQGLDYDEIDGLMSSFKFENCVPRKQLIDILKIECGNFTD